MITVLRALLVVIVLSGLAWAALYPERTRAGLARFFFEPRPALNLGIVRFVIFGSLLLSAWEVRASWYVSLSDVFLDLPRGWLWLADWFPPSPRIMRAAEIVLIASLALATLGLFTRASTVLASLLAVFVFGVPNFYFKIGHSAHVPVLCALVLASARSGDDFSLDALWARWRGQPEPPVDSAYTVPVRFVWLLTGTIYLFPGLWKWWETGDLWLTGSKLRVELFDKWSQLPDFNPWLRPDRSRAACAALGAFTLLLEVGFLPALFHPVTRRCAGLLACGFHIGIGLCMDIWFSSVQPLLVLLDVRAWPGTTPAKVAPAHPSRATAAPLIVGGSLFFAMCVAGLAPINSWPISVYPRFANRTEKVVHEGHSLAFAVRHANGAERPLRAAFEPLGDSAAVHRLVRATRKLQSQGKERELQEHLHLLARLARENSGPFVPGDKLVIYEFSFPVDPDRRHSASRALSPLSEVDL